MSAIDRVKELLATAPLAHDDHKPPGVRCPGCNVTAAQKKVRREINRIAIPLAEELVKSQEALDALVPWLDGIRAKDVARAALRLDGLAKAMGVVE